MMASRPPQAVAVAPTAAITGIGLSCCAGNQPFALFGAVGAGLAAAAPHPVLRAPGQDAPILTASMPQLEGLDTAHDRISLLAVEALREAAAQLPATIASKEILVLTLIPGPDSGRGRQLELSSLPATLAAAHPRLASACFRFATPEQGAVAQLQSACAELAQGAWSALLFGGADSLVDDATCVTLAQAKTVMAVGAASGIVPGEGSAYLLLQANTNTGPWVQLCASHAATEPHAGHGDAHKMTGLTTALQAALATANLSPAAVGTLVLPFGSRPADAFEWHQTVEALWSRRDNIPRRFEELRPSTTLGDTGAATLPLALALGCARLNFDRPAVQNLLVCEASDAAPRGAVCLKHGTRPQ